MIAWGLIKVNSIQFNYFVECCHLKFIILECLLISLIVCIGFEQTNFCPWDKMNRIWLGQDSWYNCRKVLEEVPIVTNILPTVIEALLFNIPDEFEGSFFYCFFVIMTLTTFLTVKNALLWLGFVPQNA